MVDGVGSLVGRRVCGRGAGGTGAAERRGVVGVTDSKYPKMLRWVGVRDVGGGERSGERSGV